MNTKGLVMKKQGAPPLLEYKVVHLRINDNLAVERQINEAAAEGWVYTAMDYPGRIVLMQRERKAADGKQ